MSDSEAPPVARIGEPKNPCRKRKNINAEALSTSARGILISMYSAKVKTYGMLRPILGISLSGENRRGPIP